MQNQDPELQQWRVIYVEPGTDSLHQAMRFRAEDVTHALEQFKEAEPESRVISVLEEASFELLPAVEGDFVANPKKGVWITVRNLSVRLRDRGDELSVQIFPLGREDGYEYEEVRGGFIHEACKALVGADESPEGIREHTSGMMEHQIAAHLAEMDDVEIISMVKAAFPEKA